MFRTNSLKEDASAFIEQLQDGYNNCFPTKLVRIKDIDIRKPWLHNAEILSKIKERNRQYTLSLKNSPNAYLHQERFKQLSKDVNNLRKNLKKNYFAEKLNEAGTNTKQAWKVIHEFLGKSNKTKNPNTTFFKNGEAISGESNIAESFCDYFSSIATDLDSALRTPPSGNFTDYLGPQPENSFFLTPTSPKEIEDLCHGLDPSKSAGHDGLTPNILRLLSYEFSIPLSNLINACIQVGYFPDPLKIARVTPVFKNGDPTQFGNYRPISVLPVVSKIFEKVIQIRLSAFLNKQGSIFEGQYGFRQGHSTYMAITDLVEKVRQAWHDGSHCSAVFIDFRKAFDTVNHKILISKLERLGVRGTVLELFKSYLENRKQYVIYGETKSALQEVGIGVPQGSILGPLLFIIYINDLPNASALLEYILFADDSNIHASAPSPEELQARLNTELGKLSDWFAHNRLSLNYVKTELIDFSKSKRRAIDDFNVEIDGKPIRRVDESKFLGVYLDKNISWRSHINNVITKISQTVGIIGRARRFMHTDQLLLLYNTMALPHLQYCLVNWGNFKEDRNLKYRDRILRLQKCFLRIIFGTHRLSHADPLFARARTLKIDDLFKQSIRCFSFKQTNNMLPVRMASLANKIDHSHNTRGSQSNLVINTSDHKSLRYTVPKHWNHLPTTLKQASTISSFKNNSKKDLLMPYSSFVCTSRNCHSCSPGE